MKYSANEIQVILVYIKLLQDLTKELNRENRGCTLTLTLFDDVIETENLEEERIINKN